MGRIVLAGVVVALCASFATPGLAQITDQACVLRCLDHGRLSQDCDRICTKGVPAAETPKPNRTALPSNAPAGAAAPQAPAAAAPSVTPPSGEQPATSQPVPQPSAQPAPRPAENAAPPQPTVQPAPQPAPRPAENTAPPQPTAQAKPQQTVKPPAPPVNQLCVLRCLDHGHLDQYCQRVCTVKRPAP